MNSNGSLYVPRAGYAEADNERALGLYVSSITS